MNKILGMAGIVLIVMLLGCDSLSGTQREAAMNAFNEMLTSGTITKSQYDALVGGLAGGTDALMSVIGTIGEIGLAVASSLFGVRLWRGSTLARKGTSPTP